MSSGGGSFFAAAAVSPARPPPQPRPQPQLPEQRLDRRRDKKEAESVTRIAVTDFESSVEEREQRDFRPRKLSSRRYERSKQKRRSNVPPRSRYDPWRDIYQRGDFMTQADRIKSDRRSVAASAASAPAGGNRRHDPDPGDDSEYYYYYEDLPIGGVEYLYDYHYGGADPHDRADRKEAEEGSSGRWPYDFEKPVSEEELRRGEGGVHGADPFSSSKKQAAAVSATGGEGGNQAAEKVSLGQQQQPPLLRRVSHMIFNPLSLGVFGAVAVPLMLAMAYWLFVVNGPTPVVRARAATAAGEADLEFLLRLVAKALDRTAEYRLR